MVAEPKQHSDALKADAEWLTRERVLVLVLMAATALAFYVCYRLARPFLPALAWALALAVVAHPLHEWIARRIGNANIAATLAVVIVAALIVAPAIFVTQRIVREVVANVQTVRTEIETGRWRAALGGNPRLAPALTWIEGRINVSGGMENISTAITSRISSYVTGPIRAVAELLITLFALFYFFRDRRTILRTLRSLVPLSETETGVNG
jgi:predicted PurR-regulated permease PerM